MSFYVAVEVTIITISLGAISICALAALLWAAGVLGF